MQLDWLLISPPKVSYKSMRWPMALHTPLTISFVHLVGIRKPHFDAFSTHGTNWFLVLYQNFGTRTHTLAASSLNRNSFNRIQAHSCRRIRTCCFLGAPFPVWKKKEGTREVVRNDEEMIRRQLQNMSDVVSHLFHLSEARNLFMTANKPREKHHARRHRDATNDQNEWSWLIKTRKKVPQATHLHIQTVMYMNW